MHPWYDPIRDATIYLSTAQAMAAGDGYSYLGIPYLARPPGFSVLLMAPLRAFGLDFYALNLFVSLFGATGVALLYIHQRARLGPALAALVSASVWLMPAYQELCNRIMSDVPGLALLLACLLLERWVARSPTRGRYFGLGVAIGLSALVRSMNILLVPSIIAARLIHWRYPGDAAKGSFGCLARHAAILVLGAVCVGAPWAVRNQMVDPASPADQVSVYDYSTGMWHQDLGDPNSALVSAAEVFERIPARMVQLAHVLGSGLDVKASGNRPPDHPVAIAHIVGTAALLLGLLYVVVKRRDSAEIFALAALGMICLYFAFQNRLALPVYVICLGATVELCRDGLRRVASPRVATGVVGLGVLVLLLANLDPGSRWDKIRDRHRTLVSDSAAIKSQIDSDSCLASSAGFHHALYLGRPIYSLQMAVRRAGKIQAVEDVIDKYGVNTLVLFEDKKMEREILSYARNRYAPGEAVGTGYLFRVRPNDTPCGLRRSLASD